MSCRTTIRSHPLHRGGLRASLEEQANYVIQSVALARAAGVERYSIYKMRDEEPENDQYYGLVRNDGTPRPAYVAYQVAARELAGVSDAALLLELFRDARGRGRDHGAAVLDGEPAAVRLARRAERRADAPGRRSGHGALECVCRPAAGRRAVRSAGCVGDRQVRAGDAADARSGWLAFG